MKRKKIIGLTGSIATGKSTTAEILMELGFEIIDADKIAHLLMEKGQINYLEIVKDFGQGILDSNGEIARDKLSKLVFEDKEALNKLNELTHKNIFSYIKDRIEEAKGHVVFVDIPLLVELLKEKKMDLKFDEIWLVYVDRKTQLERLMARNSFSEEEAVKRINSQMSVEEKVDYADVIIKNDGDLDHLRRQILENIGRLNESHI